MVEHIESEIKQCPWCNATTKGHVPADLHGPHRYDLGPMRNYFVWRIGFDLQRIKMIFLVKLGFEPANRKQGCTQPAQFAI